jgi:hypothetical protein
MKSTVRILPVGLIALGVFVCAQGTMAAEEQTATWSSSWVAGEGPHQSSGDLFDIGS